MTQMSVTGREVCAAFRRVSSTRIGVPEIAARWAGAGAGGPPALAARRNVCPRRPRGLTAAGGALDLARELGRQTNAPVQDKKERSSALLAIHPAGATSPSAWQDVRRACGPAGG